jgi:hypothetical protein
MKSKARIKVTSSPRSLAADAKGLLASLVKSVPKEKPPHKWQHIGDLICECDGIMEATPLGFTVALADGGRRQVPLEGGWTEEHYRFLVPFLSSVSESQFSKAMIAQAVLENWLRFAHCQEPPTAYWLLCKKYGFDEDQWLPHQVETKGFSAIAKEMEEDLVSYRISNPRRPVTFARTERPHFDGRILSFGTKRWSFRKQYGPVQKLLTALENNGFKSVTAAPLSQIHLAPNEIQLDSDDVRDAAKYLRNKTMPVLNWHASKDGTLGWSVP